MPNEFRPGEVSVLIRENRNIFATDRRELYEALDRILQSKARIHISVDTSGNGETVDLKITGHPREMRKIYKI